MGNFGQNSSRSVDPFTSFVRGFSNKCTSIWATIPLLSEYYPTEWSKENSRFGTGGQQNQGEMMKKAAIWLLLASIVCWGLEWLLRSEFLELAIPSVVITFLMKALYFSMVVPVVFQIITRFNGDSRIIFVTLLSPLVFVGALVMFLLASTGNLSKTVGTEIFNKSTDSREDFTNPTGTFAGSGDMVTQTKPVGPSTFTSSAAPDFSKLEKKKSFWDVIFGFTPDKRFKR